MNAFEEFNFGDKYILRFYRVDNALICDINESMVPELHEVVKQINQQAEKINNLEQWQKRYLDVIEAQKEYMKAQDEKIVDLAFKLVYAERGNEVAKELSK